LWLAIVDLGHTSLRSSLTALAMALAIIGDHRVDFRWSIFALL
jgi:hypothetical protein